jgi:hypothetical protein
MEGFKLHHSDHALVTGEGTYEGETSSRFTLRRYDGGDETAIVALLKSAFGVWHSLNYWRWMYKKNPAGKPIIWIAQNGKTIIGHHAIIPVRMKVADENLTGSQGVNAATHPSYQGQGVFSSIAAGCIRDACIHNIPLTFGFSRKSIEPILKRHARRVHICFMVSMVRALNRRSLPARHVPSDILIQTANFALRKLVRFESVCAREKKDLEIQRISRFDRRVTRFWNEISRNFQIIVIRNQEYLNWRYADNPEGNYVIFVASKNKRILGYIVLKEDHREDRTLGLIVDILGFQNREKVVSCLIQTAVEYFQKRDADLVLCMISETNPYKAAFTGAGFVKSPFRRMTLTCTTNLPADAGSKRVTSEQVVTISQNSFLREKKNWFMMFGDSNWI